MSEDPAERWAVRASVAGFWLALALLPVTLGWLWREIAPTDGQGGKDPKLLLAMAAVPLAPCLAMVVLGAWNIRRLRLGKLRQRLPAFGWLFFFDRLRRLSYRRPSPRRLAQTLKNSIGTHEIHAIRRLVQYRHGRSAGGCRAEHASVFTI